MCLSGLFSSLIKRLNRALQEDMKEHESWLNIMTWYEREEESKVDNDGKSVRSVCALLLSDSYLSAVIVRRVCEGVKTPAGPGSFCLIKPTRFLFRG